MTERQSLHVLIAESDANAAEELAGRLRNCGLPIRFTPIDSDAVLTQQLTERHWAMIIARAGSSVGNLQSIVEIVRAADKHLPILWLENTSDPAVITQALAIGATDAILLGEDERLQLVIRRELKHVHERSRVRRTEAAFCELEQRMGLLLDTTSEAVAYVHDGMHIFTNKSYQKVFGFVSNDDAVGTTLLDVLAPESQEQFKHYLRAISDGQHGPFEIQCRTPDDARAPAQLTVHDAAYEGEACWQVTMQMLPAARLADAVREAAEQAVEPHGNGTHAKQGGRPNTRGLERDLVTGTLNRSEFIKNLEDQLHRSEDQTHRGALIYVAVDNFSRIQNDVGIMAGDILLADTAAVINEAFSAALAENLDAYCLARFNDEGFVALISPIHGQAWVEIGERVHLNIARHDFEVDGGPASITCSVLALKLEGDSVTTNSALSELLRGIEELRRNEAGMAFVIAETHGGVAPAMVSKHELLANVQRALDSGAFMLMFQPIISLRGDSEEHYEVFVRMRDANNPDRLMPADQFIHEAEQANLSGKIDRWVVLEAIKVLSLHRGKGHDTRLTINLSAQSLVDQGFTPWLSVALRAARMPSDALVFQIGEADAGLYLREAQSFISSLNELHCRTSISHFGASENSLQALGSLLVDYVKLDAELIEAVNQNPGRRSELARMISSLQNLGKLTIVPMVESATLLATLWQSGANYIQGHYLQEPSPDMNFDFTAEDIV